MSEETPTVSANPESPDESREDGENVLSLKDALELEDELIEHSAAVLGAASDKNCSYSDGYLNRQALYACLTCIPEAKENPDLAGGVCLACCYHCHEGHDLIELYTKRSFRCDCGNLKFAKSNNKCSLNPDKIDINELNIYNQNFSGTYCVCHRPYPDPEDPIPDEMIQCIICEDWYHSRHLGVEVPGDNFAEMTCELCITKHEFLLHYDGLTANKVVNTQETDQVDPTTTQSSTETPPEEVTSITTSVCKKPEQKSENVTAKFWLDASWRKQLCNCDDCLKMYENEEVAFLLDNEDPVHLYEERSKAKAQATLESLEDQNQKLMSSMDRVQMIEVISGYNEFKEDLSEFLSKFATNKKIIRLEDVHEFFDDLKARKRTRVEIPFNCR